MSETSAPLGEETEQLSLDPDAEVFLRFRDGGEQPAFDALFEKYRREIAGYLTKFMGNRNDADDVSQEVWFKVTQKAHQFDGTKKFRSRLYGIATHQAIDQQRKNERSARRYSFLEDSNGDVISMIDTHPTQNDGPDEVALIKEARAKVREFLEGDTKQMEVLRLKYYQGITYEQMAQSLGIPLGTVKSRINAGKRAMRNLMLPYLSDAF